MATKLYDLTSDRISLFWYWHFNIFLSFFCFKIKQKVKNKVFPNIVDLLRDVQPIEQFIPFDQGILFFMFSSFFNFCTWTRMQKNKDGILLLAYVSNYIILGYYLLDSMSYANVNHQITNKRFTFKK